MKTIVTHFSPDLDAIAGIWLLRRFHPDYKTAQYHFMPGGKNTFQDVPVDTDPNVIHVDTGYGMLDHHQTNEDTCAAVRTFEYCKNKGYLEQKLVEPLQRMVQIVNDIDHFREVYYPNPNADHYEFMLHQIIEGMHAGVKTDADRIELCLPVLDGVLQVFRNKVKGEEEVKKGLVVYTSWGKALVMHTDNAEALKIAQKEGYVLVARKDRQHGRIRIKSIPNPKYDLTALYEKIKQKDTVGEWFLHIGKNMLLNGSAKGPSMKPSPLTLSQLVELIKEI